MSILDIHCDLSYLEYMLEEIIRTEIDEQLINTNFLEYLTQSNEKDIKVIFKEQRTIYNNFGIYDLYIESITMVESDIENSIKQKCCIDKIPEKLQGYTDTHYPTLSLVYKGFTLDEIQALIMYLNMKKYPRTSFREASNDLINRSKKANFRNIIEKILNCNTVRVSEKWPEVQIVEWRSYKPEIYFKDKQKADFLYNALKSVYPELELTVSKNSKHFSDKYTLVIEMSMDEHEYLGICHLLRDRYNME